MINPGYIIAPFMVIMGGAYLLKNRKQLGGSYFPVGQEYAKGIMEREKFYIIIDVRSPEEYVKGRIPGAINIPLSTIDRHYCPDELPRFDQKLLIYGSGEGQDSKIAAGKLAKLGYSDISEFGGFETWPYETEIPASEQH